MTNRVAVTSLVVGDALPELVHDPIERETLARFAAASYDFSLLHLDPDYARAAGMPDVFAHGMLSMAYLAQLLTRWMPQAQICEWHVRFTALTHLNAVVHCRGTVIERFDHDGEARLRVALLAVTGDGVVTVAGTAVVALSPQQERTAHDPSPA